MKKILLFLVLFCSMSILNAQDLSVNPNPASFEGEGLDLSDTFLEVINHATMKNETSAEGSFAWKRTIVSAPTEWEFPVCDKNICYFPNVGTSPNPVVLAGNEEGLLDVHLFPRGVAGCGTVMLELTPFDNLDNVLYSAMYEFKVNVAGECAVTTSTSDVTISKIRVYPNPTSDLFKISELENIPEAGEVAVYNIVGKKVKSFSPTASEYSVGDLPDGLYMVSVISEDAGILKTVRMSKNSLRP